MNGYSDNQLPDINSVVISGRLTQDPTIRETKEGRAVGTLRIAVNRRFQDRKGEWRKEASYVDVVVWHDSTCKRIKKSLAKGSGILVEGRVNSRDWEDKNGKKRTTVEIVANRVQFVDKFSWNGNDNNGSSSSEEEKSHDDEDDKLKKFIEGDDDEEDDDLDFP